MKVPLSILKEYITLSCSTDEIVSALTLAGIEVDAVKKVGSTFSDVVVAVVKEVKPHPTADRLVLAEVFDGRETVQVACGASNCRTGMKTALAKVGAQLTDPEGKTFSIKKARLKGEDSFGMLCGADELQLGTSEGILELALDAKTGADLSSLVADEILELSLTPNLGHCLSILGIARELSAHLQVPLINRNLTPKEQAESIQGTIDVELVDSKQCERYACRLVRSVKIGPSPQWLKNKVEACGVRSINSAVDVGNLVMLELGQPLHMFDYNQIAGKKLIITSSTKYKEMQTLDGQVREIPPSALLICDEKAPLAFGGIMGGSSSAVQEDTTDILIEAAHFSPQSIRKTSRLLGLKSDSSSRFEKGVDPELPPLALNYAAWLLEQVASGKTCKGFLDSQDKPYSPRKVACRTERTNALLGVHLSTSEIAQLLLRLQMNIVEEGADHLIVEIPSFRMDIQIEEDLIEEVARVFGYQNIPRIIPKQVVSSLADAPAYTLERRAREYLRAQGLQELMTCDLISPLQSSQELMHGMQEENVVRVLQAHSADQSVLRTTLLSNLLQAVKHNSDYSSKNIAGFEVGRIHFKEQDAYVEPSVAGIILTGDSSPYHFDPKPRDFDFFDLKGIVENFLASFKLCDLRFEASHFHQFHPGRQAKVFYKEVCLGSLGQIHPALALELDLSQPLFFAEITLSEILSLISKEWAVKPLAQFPGSERDWTVGVRDTISCDALLVAIRNVESAILEKVTLLDLYKSEQMGQDTKNITVRLFYRGKEKTLSFEEVENEHARIVNEVSGQGGID